MSSLTNENNSQANPSWKQVKTGLDGKSMLTGLASVHTQASLEGDGSCGVEHETGFDDG